MEDWADWTKLPWKDFPVIALAVNPQRILRTLTGAPDGVASSDWLARCLGCEPDDLVEPLADLASARRVQVWAAAPGVLGIVLARTTRTRAACLTRG
jgi:hypothetical protein